MSKKKINLDQVESVWRCEECGTEACWNFYHVHDAGSPVCGECGDDMAPHYALLIEPEPPAMWNYTLGLVFSMDLPYSPEELDDEEVWEEWRKTSTPDIQKAIAERVAALINNNELHEAIGPPQDGYEVKKHE